jgi:hypothetical protein
MQDDPQTAAPQTAPDDRPPEGDGIAQEVAKGKDAATPFVALGGTALVIGALFALALGIVVLAYVLGS